MDAVYTATLAHICKIACCRHRRFGCFKHCLYIIEESTRQRHGVYTRTLLLRRLYYSAAARNVAAATHEAHFSTLQILIVLRSLYTARVLVVCRVNS